MATFPSVLIAVDKFKGSLSGAGLSEAIAEGMKDELGRSFEPLICPIADGGDGTVEAALTAGFREIMAPVSGPLGEPVEARFAYEDLSQTAVIEVAEACGLWRMDSRRLDAVNSTTFGVGELILAALDAGARHIVVGLGGSATTDAGAGMLQALGVKILDDDGEPLRAGGGALLGASRVDVSGLDNRLDSIDFTVACDVTNSLLGPNGAAAVFGPQKGATEEQVFLLDRSLKHFSHLFELDMGVSRETFSTQEGAGAAGGLGFACLALGAKMRPGVDICFELTGFHQVLEHADVVITGEGKLDEQTFQGKGPAGVASAACTQHKRTLAVCGSNELTAQRAEKAGFERVFAVLDMEYEGHQVTLAESLKTPSRYVKLLGAEIARYLRESPN